MAESVPEIGPLITLTVVSAWIVGGGLYWWLRRRGMARFERLEEADPKDTLRELKDEWKPRPEITIRTQAEYLPFLVEAIREVVDQGLDDNQVICLQERFEHSRAHETRRASFTIETGGRTDTLSLEWNRDDSDRIELRVRAAPQVIRALRKHRRKIPRSQPTRARG